VPLPAEGPQQAEPVNSEYELGCAAATGAALIELALSESQRPVTALAEALARVTEAVSAGIRPAAGDLDACIECLQFHDRLTQQLSQVRDLLAAIAAAGSASAVPGGRQSWPVLIERLRARFTSDSHRILFNLLMPDAHDPRPLRTAAANTRAPESPAVPSSEGSVELF
jgi:hypothetical protein